ncbi:MAG TPA: serine hydrolase [Gaiellaceae bacterium]|nr:serine hydrolase [Gaiellaceae bacterium]
MIDAPALPPPAISAPASREVSFGLVTGRAPLGTRRVIVRIGERVLADRPLHGQRFALRVTVPAALFALRVTAVDRSGRRSSSVVKRVYGLPSGSEPLQAVPRLDPFLARTLRSLTGAAGGTTAFYVQDLRTGRGAAWNARARFPAASTLKLAIAVTVMRSLAAKPSAGSELDALLHAMLISSDNAAANRLETWLAGSTSAGSGRVNETMRALGLNDSLMYGGYETPRAPAALTPIPIRTESQPVFGAGKYTTAWDLGRLARATYLAASARGPLVRLGVSPPEARYLLWLLAQVTDRGKLDRYLGRNAVVLHKAGWLESVRHDNGIVAFAGGAFVATVMSWQTPRADELAGRVSQAALKRFRAMG